MMIVSTMSRFVDFSFKAKSIWVLDYRSVNTRCLKIIHYFEDFPEWMCKLSLALV